MCGDGTLRLGLTHSYYGGTPEAARRTADTLTRWSRAGYEYEVYLSSRYTMTKAEVTSRSSADKYMVVSEATEVFHVFKVENRVARSLCVDTVHYG